MSKAKLTIPVAHTRYKLKPRQRMKPLGKCKYHKKQISINRALKSIGPWSAAFWHEWFHAVFHEGGYESQSDNEALVEFLGQAMLRMLDDKIGSEIIRQSMLKLKKTRH